ncbi:MAG: lysine--tRNA ligase [Candidatus Hydrothermales bacterium]
MKLNRSYPEEYEIRFKKLKKLKEEGIEPFAYKFDSKIDIKLIRENESHYMDKDVKTAGRLKFFRDFGKLIFAVIEDEKEKIQIVIEKKTLDKKYEIFRKYIDPGDIIGVEGKVGKTQKGELSIFVKDFDLLTKALLPLPEKYHGLKDPELIYRKRYLHLISDLDSREVFRLRTKIFDFIRNFLNKEKFIEVETPILQPIYGGATARPFKTYSNALDAELYLRISNELYLKRLIVGGFERVYEFSKDFRNEGIDRSHYPEFTLLEGYVAYWDYNILSDFIENLLYSLVVEIKGNYEIEYQGKKISFKRPFKKVEYIECLKTKLGFDPLEVKLERLIEIASNLGIEEKEYPKVLDKLFDFLCSKDFIDPTFVFNYPKELSPLAKVKRDDDRLTERFELYIAGMEIVNAFSELNDPVDQEERFLRQLEMREKGYEEAHSFDEDYIEALCYGMPPTAGFGIGMDRLCMILADKHNIRDVILFPGLRPKTK